MAISRSIISAGDTLGPPSATDNSLARFDGTTGKLIKNSLALLNDAGQLSGLTKLDVAGDITATGNLTVEGTTTTINSEIVNIEDNHLYLNKEYTAFTAQTGGLVINYLPVTGTINVVAASTVTAGAAGTADPKLNLVNTFTYSTGDVIQFSGNPTYDGLYEVATHSAGILSIKGIGANTNTLDFVQTDFVANTNQSVTIVKVNVAVLRAGIDGEFEVASGSTALSLTFKDLTTQAAAFTTGSIPFSDSNGDLAQDNANLFWNDVSNRLGIGVSTPDATLHTKSDIDGQAGGLHIESAGNNTRIFHNVTANTLVITKNGQIVDIGGDDYGTLNILTGGEVTFKGAVKIGGDVSIAPIASAISEADSTTKGVMGVRWTTSQETTNTAGLGSGDEGLTWFNKTTKQFMGWNGTSAVILG